MEKALDKVTSKRRKQFCLEYVSDPNLNATEAYIKAGYNPKNRSVARRLAGRLMSNDDIRKAIAELMGERAVRAQIDADWVLEYLKEIVERCMTAKQVCDKEGNFLGHCKFDAGGAVRALELIGKHIGMFTDHIKVGGDEDPIKMQSDIRKQVIAEILASINGATRGLPKPPPDYVVITKRFG